MHVIAPLTPWAEWPEVKDFAHRLAMAVAQSDPDNFTAALRKAQRKGRIFVDYLRNQRGATAVSLRRYDAQIETLDRRCAAGLAILRRRGPHDQPYRASMAL